MCSDFLYQLRRHRRHFVKFVLCLCLFLCINMFKTIEGAANCEIRSVIHFLNARNVLQSEIHHQIWSVKCMVTMRWVMARLGNGFGCSMKDERRCTMRCEVGVHLWWMMIWCVGSAKECVMADVSQFLICPCTFLTFQGLYSMTLSAVANMAVGRTLPGGYTKLVPRYDKCLNSGGECVEK